MQVTTKISFQTEQENNAEKPETATTTLIPPPPPPHKKSGGAGGHKSLKTNTENLLSCTYLIIY